jgi:cytochrome P450
MSDKLSQNSAEPLAFNPFDPGFRIDPYPTYRRLREEDPIHETPFGAHVLSRYADCVAVLRDSRSSSDSKNSLEYQQFVAEQGEDPNEGFLGGARPFLFLDPPDHTRLRGLVSKAFTPRVVEGLRPRIQQLVDGLLDARAGSDSMEVIEDLAYPLPVGVICEMMGVPTADHATFKEWSRALARSLDPVEIMPAEEVEQRQRTVTQFADYFRALIEERRAEPKDDLLSALIAAEEAGDKLTAEELLATCILLLVAGHETTVNLIGNGTLALLRNPDQLQQLRDNPSLAKNAVEEVLRYDPPVQMTVRIALEDMAIGEVALAKGKQAILLLASANRDPDQFPDPERFDITRDASHHIAFGYGIHFCLGAPLARIEGEIALGTLVRRVQGLELRTEAPAYKENIVLRGLAALPVGFSAVSA